MTTSIWLDLMGSGTRERYVDAGGIRTRVLEAGPEDGPALLLFHGTGGHAETYCRNLGPLAAGGLRVLALDLVGHGFTDRPSDFDGDLGALAAHVVAVMDALGIEKAHVSGESLGGMVAAWTAISHPDRVEKCVMNTGTLARPGAAGQAQLDDLEKRTHAVAEQGVTREGIRHRMEWLVSNPEDMTDEMVECRLRIYSQPGMLEDAARTMSGVVGMLRGDRGEQYMAPGVLRELKKQTLVLWTVDNPGQTTDLARETTKDIPDARFEVLQDCAHWPQFEQPERFNALHLEFLT